MSEYRLYVFLMDGGCRVSTRATSYEQAERRLKSWSDDIQFVESLDDPLAGKSFEPRAIRFEPVKVAAPIVKTQAPASNLYAQAINQALENS
jgi:hypothetical protein